MPTAQIIMLAVGLSMDAFAVAVTLGLGMQRFSWGKAGVVGGYFGFFQFIMPVAGFFAARFFADAIMMFDTWVVFALLVFLGGKMIAGARKQEETGTVAAPGARFMLPFALATSVDALAVGISFAFLQVNIWFSALAIGIITCVLSMAGVKIGAVFGERYKTRAIIAGGVILILIGLRVLVEGLFF